MLDNATTAQDSWLSLTQGMEILLCMYIVMKAVIFGGNLLTIATICVDRALHAPVYIFTALLAGADLVVGLSGVYDVMVLTAPNFLPLLSCPFNFLVIAAIVQAAQCTVLIALDRTLEIKYPLHYPLWMTTTRTAAVVALSVVASLTYAAVIVNEMAWSSATCDIWTNTETHDRVLKELAPVCFFVPVSGCLYVHILTIAYRQRAAIAKMYKIRPTTDNQHPELRVTGKMRAADRKPADVAGRGAGAQRPSTSILLQRQMHRSRMRQGGSSARAPRRGSEANDAAGLYVYHSTPKQLGHSNCEKKGAPPEPSPSISAAAHLPFARDESRRNVLQHDSRFGVAVGNKRDNILTSVQSPASSCLQSNPGCSLYDVARETAEPNKPRTGDGERQCSEHPFKIHCNSRRMCTAATTTTTPSKPKVENKPVFIIQVAERKQSHRARSAFIEEPSNPDLKAERGDQTVMELTPEINMAFSARDTTTLQSKKTSTIGCHMRLIPGLMENKTWRNVQAAGRSLASPTLAGLALNLEAASEMQSETVPSAPGAVFDLQSLLPSAHGKDGSSVNSPTSPVVLETRSESEASSLSVVTGRTLADGREKREAVALIGMKGSVQLGSSGAWRACRMFFLVWGVYFLTIIPSVVFAVILLTSPVSREQTNFMVRLDGIFVYINSGINVFIYAWKDRRLRKSLWLALKCRWSNI